MLAGRLLVLVAEVDEHLRRWSHIGRQRRQRQILYCRRGVDAVAAFWEA
jgi:hypothetical protein